MITSLFASILAILYFKISFDTIKARRKNKISLGTGHNNEIEKYVSAHSNFAAYTPLLLILFFLIESSGQYSATVVYILGTLFAAGRVLHYLGMTSEKMNFKLRGAGMMLTLLPLNIMALLNIIAFVQIRF